MGAHEVPPLRWDGATMMTGRYACPTCGKAFRTRAGLTVHMTTAHRP